MHYGISASHVHTQCVSHITSWYGTPLLHQAGIVSIQDKFLNRKMTVLVYFVQMLGTSRFCECLQM